MNHLLKLIFFADKCFWNKRSTSLMSLCSANHCLNHDVWGKQKAWTDKKERCDHVSEQIAAVLEIIHLCAVPTLVRPHFIHPSIYPTLERKKKTKKEKIWFYPPRGPCHAPTNFIWPLSGYTRSSQANDYPYFTQQEVAHAGGTQANWCKTWQAYSRREIAQGVGTLIIADKRKLSGPVIISFGSQVEISSHLSAELIATCTIYMHIFSTVFIAYSRKKLLQITEIYFWPGMWIDWSPCWILRSVHGVRWEDKNVQPLTKLKFTADKSGCGLRKL